jgi:hypothetical protein
VQTPATSCVLCPVFKNPFSINRGEASEWWKEEFKAIMLKKCDLFDQDKNAASELLHSLHHCFVPSLGSATWKIDDREAWSTRALLVEAFRNCCFHTIQVHHTIHCATPTYYC